MDSLIFLAKLCPSLPSYYLEVIVVSGVACLAAVMMNGWGDLQVLFVYFTKGPGRFPLCNPHHNLGHHIGTNRWHHFG